MRCRFTCNKASDEYATGIAAGSDSSGAFSRAFFLVCGHVLDRCGGVCIGYNTVHVSEFRPHAYSVQSNCVRGDVYHQLRWRAWRSACGEPESIRYRILGACSTLSKCGATHAVHVKRNSTLCFTFMCWRCWRCDSASQEPTTKLCLWTVYAVMCLCMRSITAEATS
jgi:hypothetical protein